MEARGGSAENTPPFFDLALREGAEGIAVDVQLSADGTPPEDPALGIVLSKRPLPL